MVIIKFLLIVFLICITIMTALILNYSAKEFSSFDFITLGTILIVLGVNFFKFKIWGKLYEKFDLHEIYPLTSLFFPIIYLVSIYKGEAVFEINKLIGVFFILIGIYIMHREELCDDK